MIQSDGGDSIQAADTSILDSQQPGLLTTLEDSIEALVRAAHGEWTQIGGPHSDADWPGASSRSLDDRADGQEPRKVISWADIEKYAETATDIGPQIRTELARYHLPRSERELLITPISTPRKWPGRVMVAVSVAAVLSLGLLRLTHGPAGAGPVNPPTVTPLGRPSGAPSVSSHQSAARPAPKPGLTITLRITSRCWLRVSADGRVMVEETLPAGRVVRFHAKKYVQLVMGNAGGVTLRVNGKLVPTGRLGQVVHLSFTWSKGRVSGR